MSDVAERPTRRIAGRYDLEAQIGTGGIGEVWRARHVALNSYVAIKFLQGASAQNESARRRFTTEAQVTAQLNSRHAVQVFDFGVTDDGHPYLVMELLQGETLGRRLEREGRLGVIETARILGQSAKALHRAHQLGIVHRDFKPDNIVISADEEGRDYVKVVDFGIAKLVGDLDRPSEPTEIDFASTAPPVTFTKTGSMLGTPSYMAPEQIVSPAEVDLRADVWAFGVVAFECLTGCAPFTGETLLELFKRIESGTHSPADHLEPSVPTGFSEWFDTACAPDPRKRFADVNASYKELLAALDCGRVDLEPSTALGRNPSDGERQQVVVQPAPNVVDGHAITVDAPSKRGVQSRQNRSPRKTASLRRISARPPPRESEPEVLGLTIADDGSGAATLTTPASRIEEAVRPPRAGRPRALVLLAISLLAILGIVAWRLSARFPAPTVVPAAGASPPTREASQPSTATSIEPEPARPAGGGDVGPAVAGSSLQSVEPLAASAVARQAPKRAAPARASSSASASHAPARSPAPSTPPCHVESHVGTDGETHFKKVCE